VLEIKQDQGWPLCVKTGRAGIQRCCFS